MEAGGYVEGQTQLPYYKPKVYPIVLRKNVSAYGKLLGDSDVDKVEDQQETLKKLSTKTAEKLLKGGSVLTLPKDAVLDLSNEELRVLRLNNAADKSMIDVYNLQPDINNDLTYEEHVYEEGRQIIGITDSFQGRKDATATSGTAKEFSAKQAAGRLESKRSMKDASWSVLFELMFKWMLAYDDEPRQVVSHDTQGKRVYKEFDRRMFLKQDAAGEWYYEDEFLFSVDASATLAQNREAMWQECRLNYQQGCYGEIGTWETLQVFWTRMEQLNYPGAADMKTYAEQKIQEAQQQMQMAAQVVPQTTAAAPDGMEEAGADTAAQIVAMDQQQDNRAMYINGGGEL
jgi:hypothetical protein